MNLTSALLALAFSLIPLSSQGIVPPCIYDEAVGPYVDLVGPTDRSVRVYVEVADTPELRERGLMYRTELDADKGMIFLWAAADIHAFWMKNTYIPLDMMFIHKHNVVGIVENAEPQTETPRFVDAPSDAVLEVPAGTAARHGITTDWSLYYCLSAPQQE